jgi:hypothetical protein
MGCVVGVTKDVFLFGNATKFAPEWTLMKGGCERIAILFRIRRFVALVLRSVWRGDVPFGAFWFGWTETRWTPSGFEGWTTGKSARSILWGRVTPQNEAAPPRASLSPRGLSLAPRPPTSASLAPGLRVSVTPAKLPSDGAPDSRRAA